MNQFYVHFNEEELGPLSIAELKTLKVTRNTMTWYEGLEEWKPAGEIGALQSLFPPKVPPPIVKEAVKPPPIVKETVKPKLEEAQAPKQQAPTYVIQQQPEKKSNGVGKFILFLLIIGGLFVGFLAFQEMERQKQSSSQSLGFGSSSTNANTYEQNVVTVEEQERQNPTRFLSASGQYRDNILGNKTVIMGTISNSAAKATFKDVVVEIKFYSDTESLITSEQYTVYEYFSPGTTKDFNLKIKHPRGTEKVGWKVISAVPQ